MSGWVSVEMALPDADVEVLVATYAKSVFVAWLPENEGGGWEAAWGPVRSWITHWQSLPEPPK